MFLSLLAKTMEQFAWPLRFCPKDWLETFGADSHHSGTFWRITIPDPIPRRLNINEQIFANPLSAPIKNTSIPLCVFSFFMGFEHVLLTPIDFYILYKTNDVPLSLRNGYWWLRNLLPKPVTMTPSFSFLFIRCYQSLLIPLSRTERNSNSVVLQTYPWFYSIMLLMPELSLVIQNDAYPSPQPLLVIVGLWMSVRSSMSQNWFKGKSIGKPNQCRVKVKNPGFFL